MNATEKLADDLGQIIFRLETNFHMTLRRNTGPDPIVQPAIAAVVDDLEKLKALKIKLQELSPESPKDG